jgi:hypothetical protein
MVLGNDEVEAATTQILNGPTGSEIGTGGFNQPDHGDRQRLWNLASRIPSPTLQPQTIDACPAVLTGVTASLRQSSLRCGTFCTIQSTQPREDCHSYIGCDPYRADGQDDHCQTRALQRLTLKPTSRTSSPITTCLMSSSHSFWIRLGPTAVRTTSATI